MWAPHVAVGHSSAKDFQAHSSSKMSTLIPLMFFLIAASCADMQQDAEDDFEPQPEHFDGRSFFFLGTLFRRWRDRWMAFHNPSPLYAGAAFPLNGYYNCPSFGCNPAAIGPQPGGFYPSYYATPLQQQQQQQQQQAQGNSNVYIYSSDQNAASSSGMQPYGPGFFGPPRQPMPLTPPPPPPPPRPLPLPLPPPPLLPPGSQPPQVSASSFGFGFGSGPVPYPGCGPNPLSCALG